MKKIFALIIFISLLLAACTSNKEEVPCKEFADSNSEDKEWLTAKCFEETALEKRDLMVCSYLGNEVSSKTGELRVYSRASCRNLVNNALAYSSKNTKYCELIDEKAKLFTEPPDIEIKDFEKLKDRCRDLLNR